MRRHFAVLFLALSLFGCSTPPPSVTGLVTFKGQPLPSGTVLFHGSEGRVEYSLISESGTYTITNAPLGPVRITVQSHPSAPRGMPSRGGPPPTTPANVVPPPKETREGKAMPIPRRLADSEQSGLVYTVRPGAQTHDIKLQP